MISLESFGLSKWWNTTQPFKIILWELFSDIKTNYLNILEWKHQTKV